MPKTINSKRNQLSESELKRYATSKEFLAVVLRPDLKKKFPKFKYSRIFTEARAGGALRSKFWISRNEAMVKKIVEWGNTYFSVYGVKFEIHDAVPWSYAKSDLVIKID